MKKLLSMLLIGVLLIGIGGAISVFEFSGYSYNVEPTSNFFANSTTSINVRTPNDTGNIYFDSYNYSSRETTVAVDETLSDQTLRLDIYGPNQVFKYRISPSGNSLHLYYETDPFKVISAILEGMKQKEFISVDDSDFSVKIYASQATAQRIVIGQDPAIDRNREQIEQMRLDYQDNMDDLRANYEENLADVRANYEEQLKTQRENYEERLQTQQETFDEQLLTQKENYEEQLNNLKNTQQ